MSTAGDGRRGTRASTPQRISAVLELDKIVLLQNGEIVGMGNHKELMETSELYQEIYESQLGGSAIEGIDLSGEEVAE